MDEGKRVAYTFNEYREQVNGGWCVYQKEEISDEEKHLRSLKTITPQTYNKLKAKEALIK